MLHYTDEEREKLWRIIMDFSNAIIPYIRPDSSVLAEDRKSTKFGYILCLVQEMLFAAIRIMAESKGIGRK